MSWPMVKLSQLVEIMHQGINTAADKVVYSDSGMPIIQAKHLQDNGLVFDDVKFLDTQDVMRYESKYIPKNNDILFSNIGTIGKSVIVKESLKFMFAWNVFVIRPIHEKLDVSFLKYYLDKLLIEKYYDRFLTGGTVKFVNKKVMGDIEIPLPPLAEQKRIAAILDKADAIRRKRQQAVQLADDFLRAVFLEMFGDPVTNPKGWEVRPLGEIVDIKGGGTPSKSDETYWNGDIPWASVKDIKSKYLNKTSDFITDSGVTNSATNVIPKGTIITPTRMALGRFVINTIDVAINQDLKALFLRPNFEIEQEYLVDFLRSQQGYIESEGKGATVKGITLDCLRTIQILIPPIGIQRKYRDLKIKLEKVNAKFDTAFEQKLDFFKASSDKAFSGQL